MFQHVCPQGSCWSCSLSWINYAALTLIKGFKGVYYRFRCRYVVQYLIPADISTHPKYISLALILIYEMRKTMKYISEFSVSLIQSVVNFLTCWWTNNTHSFICSQSLWLKWMNGPSHLRAIAAEERLNVCIRMCLPLKHVKEPFSQGAP